MPTPSEQKALTFVAMVVLLGGAVRVVRAGSSPTPSALEQQALARQATAVESAATSSRARPRGGRAPRGRRASADSTRGGKPTGASAASVGIGGYPPPGPRIDVDYRTNPRRSGSEVIGGGSMPDVGRALVDLDRASEREIDVLPRVGPALARRLVANRDSLGPFGSLEALGRVKGFGPATRKRLSPLVTFSGRPSSRP
jgi:competence protein ComEA